MAHVRFGFGGRDRVAPDTLVCIVCGSVGEDCIHDEPITDWEVARAIARQLEKPNPAMRRRIINLATERLPFDRSLTARRAAVESAMIEVGLRLKPWIVHSIARGVRQ